MFAELLGEGGHVVRFDRSLGFEFVEWFRVRAEFVVECDPGFCALAYGDGDLVVAGCEITDRVDAIDGSVPVVVGDNGSIVGQPIAE